MVKLYVFVLLLLPVPFIDSSKADSESNTINYVFDSPNETTLTMTSINTGVISKDVRSGIDEVYGNDNDEVEIDELYAFEYDMRNYIIEGGGNVVVGDIFSEEEVNLTVGTTDFELDDVSFTTTGALGSVNADQILTYITIYDFSFDIDSDLSGYIYLQSWSEAFLEDVIMTYTVPEGYEIVEAHGFENNFVGISGRTISSKVVGDILILFENPFVDVSGCKYSDADNYNPDATIDDGSCSFSKESNGFEVIIISSTLITVALLNRRIIA